MTFYHGNLFSRKCILQRLAKEAGNQIGLWITVRVLLLTVVDTTCTELKHNLLLFFTIIRLIDMLITFMIRSSEYSTTALNLLSVVFITSSGHLDEVRGRRFSYHHVELIPIQLTDHKYLCWSVENMMSKLIRYLYVGEKSAKTFCI